MDGDGRPLKGPTTQRRPGEALSGVAMCRYIFFFGQGVGAGVLPC